MPGRGPLEQPRRRPLGMRAVTVGMCSGTVVRRPRASSARGPRRVDRGAGLPPSSPWHALHLLVHERVGDRVEVPVERDVVVDVHPRPTPLRVLEGRRRQGRSAGRSSCSKSCCVSCRRAAWPIVEVIEQLADPGVQLGERGEDVVAQSRENPSLHHLHARLPPWPCREVAAVAPAESSCRSGCELLVRPMEPGSYRQARTTPLFRQSRTSAWGTPPKNSSANVAAHPVGRRCDLVTSA